MKNRKSFPLISIIIPAYNYATFILKAIKSALNQTYPNVEIIVIDDGSTDNTKEVVQSLPSVNYHYQSNKGLPASRNAGITKSSGQYLVFLDADDWLERDALEKNYAVICDKPDVAFVSGNYYLLRAKTNKTESTSASVTDNHYCHLLQSNYIGMHAAVMFQRWVFNTYRYDETLRSCEDYDLYLRIARHHPVVHHPAFIATYYFHSSGLSHNYMTMMDTVTVVIKKQASCLRSPEERMAYEKGLQQWKEYENLMKEKEANAGVT